MLRLAGMCVAILATATVAFLLIHLVPGDPVEVMLGESAGAADREALRHALGIDRPLLVQWLEFLRRLAMLDLGVSLHSQQPISDILRTRLPATLVLAAAGMLVAIVIALPLGIFAALRAGSWLDRLAMAFAVLGMSVPNFCIGPVLIIVFSIGLGWLPVSGFDGAAAVVLPSLTLGTALAAVLSRMVRAAVLESLNAEFVRTAQAKGLSPRVVVWRHVLPNAALPIVTLAGLQLGALLSGAIITETIFAWPGLGRLTVEAIVQRDYPVLQACVLVISAGYVALNAMTDVVCAMVDPRTRLRA
jgi:peptide/nickel transport system permease protein